MQKDPDDFVQSGADAEDTESESWVEWAQRVTQLGMIEMKVAEVATCVEEARAKQRSLAGHV